MNAPAPVAPLYERPCAHCKAAPRHKRRSCCLSCENIYRRNLRAGVRRRDLIPSPRSIGPTPRDLDVLKLMCQGKRNKAIGHSLGITERTVKQHIGELFRVTKTRSQAQLGAWAVRQGVL